jgi:DNA-directed RNA polymerase subunit L
MFRNYSFDSKDPSNKHSFEIHDVDIAIINGIRRTILTDIPIPGIIGEENPTIEIIKSNGPLHNEILCHRIGLIPINMSEDDIEQYVDNSIELELNMINEGNLMKNVATNDIKGKKNGKELTKKDLEILFPANQITKSHILITRLRTNEFLHFKANVVKKTARFNSAFCPVSLSNFYYIEDQELSKKKANLLDKERSYYTNKYGEANAVMFEIEPIGTLIGPKYLFSKAIEIIIDKINNLIINITSQLIKIKQFEKLKNTYDFIIENEDDTLGNIIQSYIYNKHIRNDTLICSYIGYICPHPLKSELIIRITLDDQENPNEFIKFLETECRLIIEELLNIKKEWNKFIK